jgi:DNA-binding transcriptional LysR family regulator
MFEKLFAQAGISLERMKAFADIVAAGGIMAAADDDPNRQSQLSRQLKELERYFGVELIKRGRGPMKLTEAGRQLNQVINRAFGSLEEFRLACATEPVELMIGAGESLIQWMLLPRMSQLMAVQPKVVVGFQNLRTEEILRGLADGALDFGVVTHFKAEASLDSAPLGRLEYRLFMPAAFAQGIRLPATDGVLGKVPLALLLSSSSVRQVLEETARKQRFKLDVRLRLSSYPQLAAAVQRLNLGAVMPTLAAAAMAGDKVRMIQVPCMAKLARQVFLVWNRKTADVRPSISAYAKILATLFRMPGIAKSTG